MRGMGRKVLLWGRAVSVANDDGAGDIMNFQSAVGMVSGLSAHTLESWNLELFTSEIVRW